jgi:GNAT superfamily N-acetyltransferase
MPTSTSIIIRRATTADIPVMTGLLGELFGIEEDFKVDPDAQHRGLELMLARPEERCVLVADTGSEVVGMCTLQVLVSTATGGPAGLLEDLVVTGSYRGGSIGSRLLETMESWCVSRNISRIQLLADAHNERALDFYSVHAWQGTNLVCLRKLFCKGERS